MGWGRGVKRKSVKVEQVEENAGATNIRNLKKRLTFYLILQDTASIWHDFPDFGQFFFQWMKAKNSCHLILSWLGKHIMVISTLSSFTVKFRAKMCIWPWWNLNELVEEGRKRDHTRNETAKRNHLHLRNQIWLKSLTVTSSNWFWEEETWWLQRCRQK